nr:Txe/YoeB family addiction module toxin [Mucilaginibacter ginkgonis]
MEQDPFKGIGKPEPLKHNLSGLWSRRINREHRII